MGKMKELLIETQIEYEGFRAWLQYLDMDTPSLHAFGFEDFMRSEGVQMLKKMWDKLRGNPDNTIKKLRLSTAIIDGNNEPVRIKYIKPNGSIHDYTIRPIDLDNRAVQAIDVKTSDMKEFLLERITEINGEQGEK